MQNKFIRKNFYKILFTILGLFSIHLGVNIVKYFIHGGY